MTEVDRLSDTVYRKQACEQLDGLLGKSERFPVERSQIYGLRQVARQQPGKVKEFAQHQSRRAERRHRPGLQEEVGFWSLVDHLCDSSSDWSVRSEGLAHAPSDIREENIPKKNECKTDADRRHRNRLRMRQRDWLDRWTGEHVPAFFERFCTHALYLRETLGNHRGRNAT